MWAMPGGTPAGTMPGIETSPTPEITMTMPHTRKRLVASTLVLAVNAALLAACGGGGSDPAAPSPTPPAAGFTITLASDKAVVMQGGSLAVRATVQREASFTGAVQLSLAGLPAGVSAGPVTVAANATEVDVLLQAGDAAPHSLPTAVTVSGESGAARATRGLTVTVRGAAGRVDTSFAGGVVRTPVDIGEDVAQAVAVQADGKLIVAGASATATGTWISLTRYQRDGALDTTFGTGGKVVTPVGTMRNDGAGALAVQADGRIVVAGATQSATTGKDFAIVRYQANGTLDPTFGTGGKVVVDFAGDSDEAWALLIQPDGRIVVGGSANLGTASTGLDFALLRLNADGTPDAGFGQGGKVTTPMASFAGTDVVRALGWQVVNGQARIVAAGGEGDFAVARYTPSGTLDAAWGTNGKVTGVFGTVIGGARAMTVLDDGALVVAGQADHRFAALKLTPAGQPDAGFGSAGRFQLGLVPNWNEATSLARQSDGKLILGGWAMTGAGSAADFAALRLNADGSVDRGFATNGVLLWGTAPGTKSDQAKALVLQPDERVPAVRAILAGESNDANQDFTLMRLWL